MGSSIHLPFELQKFAPQRPALANAGSVEIARLLALLSDATTKSPAIWFTPVGKNTLK
jgi:hypothetical protein